MANFSNLTIDNGAIKELSKLIFAGVLSPEKMGDLVNVLPNQKHGDKVAILNELGLVGKKAQGCNPTWAKLNVPADESTWDIMRWEITNEICAADIESTIARYALNKKTSVDDLTNTEYVTKILVPLIEQAVENLIFRLAFFGDKAADVTTSGGVLKTGTDKTYFTVTDGFFKRLNTIVTADASRLVKIDANEKTTFAEQKAAFKAKGVAIKAMQDLIEGAEPELRGAENQVIYVTLAWADALSADLKANNVGSDMQWKSLFDGIKEANYEGITLRAIPGWDKIIKAYEGTATKYNKLYRAVYTTKDNLVVGTESKDLMQELDIFFDKKSRTSNIIVKDNLGTLVYQPNLVQVAW